MSNASPTSTKKPRPCSLRRADCVGPDRDVVTHDEYRCHLCREARVTERLKRAGCYRAPEAR
jgi:hypothetical protein